jgi:hypothetical protein
MRAEMILSGNFRRQSVKFPVTPVIRVEGIMLQNWNLANEWVGPDGRLFQKVSLATYISYQ